MKLNKVTHKELNDAFDNIREYYKEGGAYLKMLVFLEIPGNADTSINTRNISDEAARKVKLLASPNYHTILKAYEIQKEAKNEPTRVQVPQRKG